MSDEWKAPEKAQSSDDKSWKLLEKTLLASVQEQRRSRLLDAWERTVAIDLNGVAYGMHAQLPVIEQYGGGAVVNIGSIHSTVATTFGHSAYTAAKHGLMGLTRQVWTTPSAGSGSTRWARRTSTPRCCAACPRRSSRA